MPQLSTHSSITRLYRTLSPLNVKAPLCHPFSYRGDAFYLLPKPGNCFWMTPKRLNGRGGTEPAKERVNTAEVSRGREPGNFPGERSEGSVIGRCP